MYLRKFLFRDDQIVAMNWRMNLFLIHHHDYNRDIDVDNMRDNCYCIGYYYMVDNWECYPVVVNLRMMLIHRYLLRHHHHLLPLRHHSDVDIHLFFLCLYMFFEFRISLHFVILNYVDLDEMVDF